MPKLSRLDVVTTGARRRWAIEEKRRIVAESYSAPRVVSATARRHGLSTSLLYRWRQLAREGRLGGGEGGSRFAPAVMVSEPWVAAVPTSPAAVGHGRMEIVLAGARRVIVDREVDAAALARVISVLERR